MPTVMEHQVYFDLIKQNLRIEKSSVLMRRLPPRVFCNPPNHNAHSMGFCKHVPKSYESTAAVQNNNPPPFKYRIAQL